MIESSAALGSGVAGFESTVAAALGVAVGAAGVDPVVAQGLAGGLETETLLEAAVRIFGFGLLAAGAAALAAFAFRWYSADEIPEGVAVLVGISPVAIWLNTQTALQDAIIGTSPLLDPATAVYTIAAFAASAIAADGGRRSGDYLARDVFAIMAPRTMDEVGQLVRSAGRVVSVDLPETIADVDGYDPVEESTKAELAGQTFLFPRRLTHEQLRERLIDRLERDHGIGHVDVELGEDGHVEHLGFGSRPAGIGPTLAPGTAAVALPADPAPDATPGDAVGIWHRRDGELRCLAEGELRGTAGDVATTAVDADDVTPFAIDSRPGGEDDDPADPPYRLVTLPGTPGAERELVSLLRAADETVTSLTVGAHDALVDESVGSLPVLVLAIERPSDGADGVESIPLPDRELALEAGDTVYVLGRPEALRRLAQARDGRGPAEVSTPGRST